MCWSNVVLFLGMTAIICPTICYVVSKHFDYNKKKLDIKTLKDIKSQNG